MVQNIKRFSLAVALFLMVILAGSATYTFAQTDEEADTEEACTAELCGTDEEIEATTTTTTTTTTTQACTKDTWSCSSWGTCSQDGSQTRTCSLTSDCESVSTPKPTEERSCIPPETIQEVSPPPTPPPPPPPSVKKQTVPPTPPPVTTTTQETTTFPKSSVTPKTPPLPVLITVETVEEPAAVSTEFVFTPEKEKIITYQEESIKKIVEAFKVNPSLKETVTKVSTDPTIDTDRDGIPDTRDPAPLNNDINRNGVPDGVEKLAGGDPGKADPEEKQLQEELVKQKETLIESGLTPKQAEKKLVTIVHQKRVEKKVRFIRKVAQEVYNIQILSNTQDSNQDGVSDELAVELGMDPKAEVKPGELSQADLKLFKTTPELASKKCSLNVYSGMKLSARGFSILGVCPKNRDFTLYLIDQNGQEVALASIPSSDNYKVVFTITNALRSGSYLLQIRPKTTGVASGSDPVMVSLVDEEELAITTPVVKKIEDVDVLTVKDIKITRTRDGRIHVSGVSDTSSVVVGTFESAVFNSALLADTKSGSFEIVSPKPLDLGDHAVTIYATRSGEAAQSRPVKVPFSIIQLASAATEIKLAEKKTTSSMPLVAGGASLVALAALITWVVTRKKKQHI